MTFEFAAFKVPEEPLLVTAHQTLVFIDRAARRPSRSPTTTGSRSGRLTPTTSSARRSPSSPRATTARGRASSSSRETSSSLGPQAGSPSRTSASTVPVVWRETRVAELAADGDDRNREPRSRLADIADLCLVGWDTSGEEWEP